ncbi:MAG: pilus assembly protein PilP, partial [Candidatus Competibacteraceae bacterium]|nr:pilus assembly protein PilP [Candidatus Competibacteraceae bacterium]
VLDALTRQEPIVDTGIRPDLDRDKEELEKYSLGSLDMVGTFSDFDNEEIWALIKAPDGIVHRVRKGNYLGENFGEIFNISEDKIEILEIVPDPQAGGWKERDNFLSLAQ